MIKQIHVNIPPRHLDGNDLWYQFMVPKSLFTLNVMFQMNFGWKWYRTTSRFICVFVCFPIMVFKWNKGNFKPNLSSLKCTCCCFFFLRKIMIFFHFFFSDKNAELVSTSKCCLQEHLSCNHKYGDKRRTFSPTQRNECGGNRSRPSSCVIL